jgi:PadR family transcriptional regulator PadR
MSRNPRRLSDQAISVLSVLLKHHESWLYGLEIADLTALKSGTLYPLLIRLSERGLLESRWQEPDRPGRPPRHAYRITGEGRIALRDSLPERKPTLIEVR